ncbi:MAG: hypothetical protein ABIN36_08375 [Ferruginibacter sp.]
MKKNIAQLALLSLLTFTILASCTKSDMKDQLTTTQSESILDEDDAAKHNNCGCHCPSSVATASSISYSIGFANYPNVAIMTSVFYKNPGPQGTLRMVLRNVNNVIDSVVIVPAYHTNAGDSALAVVQFDVEYAELPCKLRVNGRPANLDCSIRSHKIFDIFNQVSRN